MRHNRRDDGQLSCGKREMKTMNANTALDGHTTVIKMAERGGVPLIDKQKDFQRQEEIDIKKQQKICSVIDGAWERVCVHICWIHVRRCTGACICPKCV